MTVTGCEHLLTEGAKVNSGYKCGKQIKYIKINRRVNKVIGLCESHGKNSKHYVEKYTSPDTFLIKLTKDHYKLIGTDNVENKGELIRRAKG